jgi:hypothetical protein
MLGLQICTTVPGFLITFYNGWVIIGLTPASEPAVRKAKCLPKWTRNRAQIMYVCNHFWLTESVPSIFILYNHNLFSMLSGASTISHINFMFYATVPGVCCVQDGIPRLRGRGRRIVSLKPVWAMKWGTVKKNKTKQKQMYCFG